MFPEIRVHRPRGVVPKVAVRKQTVVEYQPSWLLLAVPAVTILAARRRKTRTPANPAPANPAQSGTVEVTPAATTSARGADTEPPAPRRRRTQVVRLARLRRRSGAQPVLEQADMAVPVRVDPTRRP